MATNGHISRKTIRLTTAQAVVKYLSVQHSERDGERQRLIPAIFGIFGHGNVAGLGQALYEYGGDLPYHQPRNEQSMVHTAMGYAKSKNRRATIACTASIGPGSTNMITGAATATINRIPVLLLPADIYGTRYQGNVLQQLEHPVSADLSVNDCFRPVSRFFDRILRPEQLLTALPEAMRILTDPAETGTATISLPQDIQMHAYDYPAHFFEERVWRIERRLPDPTRIREAVEMLKAAQRPLIIAGGGVHYSEAWDDLKTFAEAFDLPVGETFAGKGAIKGGSTMLLGGVGVTGNPGAAIIAAQADLVINIGTRLSDFTTGSRSIFNHPDVKFININVAGHDAYKLGAMPILADAKLALQALTQAGYEAGLGKRPDYVREAAAAQQKWQEIIAREIDTPVAGEAMSQGRLIRILNDVARAGDTVIAAAGGPPGDLHKLWDVSSGSACHIEFGYSCMGYEMPAGLGVRMGQPDGEVYVFIGDGTYLMNPSELVTAMQDGIKITVVLADNHGFQIIRNLQMNRVGRSFGNEFRARDAEQNRLEGEYLPIDFPKNAESMGARAWHVSTEAELRHALDEARAETRSCVIVVEVEKHRYLPGSGVFWDIEAAEVTNDPATQELRHAYEEDRKRVQRFYY
jgi:3D-(3,5/4)-trihydroxycyclohexane-1,2-dione acylhydrolase (decyclizing)